MVPIYQALVPYGPEERRPWAALSFPRDEYERRVAAVQARLSADGLAAVVTFSNRGDPGHARYLANFEAGPGETCVVVPAAGRAMLTTNWLMHGEPMHTMIWTTWLDDVRAADRAGFSKAPAATVAAHIADRLREAGVRRDRVGIAGGALLPHYVMVELEERLPDVAFVPADDLVLGVRAKKSPAEIDVMRRVARISGKMHEVVRRREGDVGKPLRELGHHVVREQRPSGDAHAIAPDAGLTQLVGDVGCHRRRRRL